MRGASVRGARRLTRGGVLNQYPGHEPRRIPSLIQILRKLRAGGRVTGRNRPAFYSTFER